MRISKRTWRALVLGLLTLLVTACGDSHHHDVISGQLNGGGGGGGGGQLFPGRYLGAANIETDQTSVLDITVANNGDVTGDLTVTNVVGQTININPGAYAVNGTANLATGSFSLSGVFPGIGPVSLAGTLPVGNALSSYTVNINGQIFNGAIQNASQGVPNPPNNGGGDADVRMIRGGLLSNFNFTPNGAYNGVNPPIDTDSMITGAYRNGSDEDNILTLAISETMLIPGGATVRSLIVGIVAHDGEELEVGKSYPLVVNPDDSGSLLTLSEGSATSATAAWVSDASVSTGTATIVSLDDESVVLEFAFTNIVVDSALQPNQAAGGFSASGTIEGQFAAFPTP